MAETASQVHLDRLAIKQVAREFLAALETIGTRSGKTRELALAKTDVERAELWALKHIGGANG